MKATPGSGGLGRSAAARWASDLQASWRRAVETAGQAHEIWLELAGKPVVLRFAGFGLEPNIAEAFAHLLSGPPLGEIREVALAVHLWDGMSTGSAPPPPPADAVTHSHLGRIRLESLCDEDHYAELQWGSYALSAIDLRTGVAHYWVRDPADLPPSTILSPLLTIFALWLRRRGIEPVHGAAVGTETACALLVGPTRSGKSTTALAAVADGLRLLSDDYCAVTADAAPVVHSIYATANAQPDTLRLIPWLLPAVDRVPSETGNARVFLYRRHPDRLLGRAPLRAVLVPARSGTGATRLQPLAGRTALAALAPSSLAQMAGSSQESLRRLAAIVRRVPVYRLEAGADPHDLASAVRSALA